VEWLGQSWDGRCVTTNAGAGPGAITPDGCAVQVYARLPAMGEPEVIHAALCADASILDLGAGVGRVADPLVELGHRVVAVDESPDMLAHVRSATPVRSRIEELQLSERFDACLLASFLLNTPDAEQRRTFLSVARHHLAPAGVVLAQWHPPEWFDSLAIGAVYAGGARYMPGRQYDDSPIATTLTINDVSNGLLTALATYEQGDQRWTHRWQAEQLSVQNLDTDLQSSGLYFDGFLTGDRTWLRAQAQANP
jgi:SAM-dependent methyltransferase